MRIDGYCPGGGNWVKAKRRKTLTGPQVQCHECGRWLRQPRDRPRSVPAHKPFTLRRVHRAG